MRLNVYMTFYKKLTVWQKALRVSQMVYHLTALFPKDQKFGLSSQMQRAAVSIMSNVAEGSKKTEKEWYYFIRIALGSAAELESQLCLAESLHFGSENDYQPIMEELGHVSRILQAISSKRY